MIITVVIAYTDAQSAYNAHQEKYGKIWIRWNLLKPALATGKKVGKRMATQTGNRRNAIIEKKTVYREICIFRSKKKIHNCIYSRETLKLWGGSWTIFDASARKNKVVNVELYLGEKHCEVIYIFSSFTYKYSRRLFTRSFHVFTWERMGSDAHTMNALEHLVSFSFIFDLFSTSARASKNAKQKRSLRALRKKKAK